MNQKLFGLKVYSKFCSWETSGKEELNLSVYTIECTFKTLQRLYSHCLTFSCLLLIYMLPGYGEVNVCWYSYTCMYVCGYVSMQKAVWCLCFYGKNLLISGSGDQRIKVMHSNLLSCMCGSEIMTEVTNLSSLACFRSGTSRLGPVNGEITQVHVTRNPMLCLHSCGLVYVHFLCQSTCTCSLVPRPHPLTRRNSKSNFLG